MSSRFPWEEFDTYQWMVYANNIKDRPLRVRIVWMGNIYGKKYKFDQKRFRRLHKRMVAGHIQARVADITGNTKLWHMFADTAYVPVYKYDKTFHDLGAENKTLRDFAAEIRRDGTTDSKLLEYGTKKHTGGQYTHPICTIMTVYHTVLNMRLIVDGLHRSTALVNDLFYNDERMPPMKGLRILELYGPLVHQYFPYDFAGMILRELLYAKCTTLY